MAIITNKNKIKYFCKNKIILDYIDNLFGYKSTLYNEILNFEVETIRKKIVGDIVISEQFLYLQEKKSFLEGHKKFIDIQICVYGYEKILYCNKNKLNIFMAYNTENDCALYCASDKLKKTNMTKGDISIFFPSDAHMPLIKHKNCLRIFKVVLKIPICFLCDFNIKGDSNDKMLLMRLRKTRKKSR
ncbi:YhcH/YjgK/YiaL family protein [Campylobacter lari subsp. concheus]|uniref:YhcH/YjgK/YiaL family protein n=1 Tax=Campylobacter lari TaxID=201 RepID=UPI0017F38E0F|nr:YhcH/YjgK/YiaL family protein [Campylobacter lari]EAJ5701981.1 DUF386 domain-containing protein [Campylobacter lari]MCR2078014.1 YhcH/YjgK/YiaL family protein [Campylobacter lari subsp. concheus]MCR2087293.1 YhcH/YjgK/YiaL family protein [Campylobacter lari subsp. concheus]